MLEAERSSLFINDEKTNELFTMVGEGLSQEIRFPNHMGIAGHVFSTGETVNIPHAYADLRFNPGVDKSTEGLCHPPSFDMILPFTVFFISIVNLISLSLSFLFLNI